MKSVWWYVAIALMVALALLGVILSALKLSGFLVWPWLVVLLPFTPIIVVVLLFIWGVDGLMRDGLC